MKLRPHVKRPSRKNYTVMAVGLLRNNARTTEKEGFLEERKGVQKKGITEEGRKTHIVSSSLQITFPRATSSSSCFNSRKEAQKYAEDER
jgi:hypothetical protein